MDGIIYCDIVGTCKPDYNPSNGQWLKGHKPHNKGRKWDEWATPEAIENMKKGWTNLDLHRPKSRPDTAERCRKPVVAIDYYGKLYRFDSSRTAFDFLAGGHRTLISRCCRFNHDGLKPTYKPFGKKLGKKPTQTNTDHSYMGFRWYFEADVDIWKDKLNEQYRRK